MHFAKIHHFIWWYLLVKTEIQAATALKKWQLFVCFYIWNIECKQSQTQTQTLFRRSFEGACALVLSSNLRANKLQKQCTFLHLKPFPCQIQACNHHYHLHIYTSWLYVRLIQWIVRMIWFYNVTGIINRYCPSRVFPKWFSLYSLIQWHKTSAVKRIIPTCNIFCSSPMS